MKIREPFKLVEKQLYIKSHGRKISGFKNYFSIYFTFEKNIWLLNFLIKSLLSRQPFGAVRRHQVQKIQWVPLRITTIPDFVRTQIQRTFPVNTSESAQNQ